jgi:peptidyl-prolyl cis-trans isomerase SurA
MRKALPLFAILCLAVGVAVAGNTVVEEIIARVNDKIITRSELQRARENLVNEVRQNESGSEADHDIAEGEKNLLRDLIDQQLLIQKGQELGITADTELIKRLDEIRKQMKLDTMEDLEKAAQQQGVSFEDFKQNIRNSIITQDVIGREVGSNIKISSEEANKYYDEHKAQFDRPEQVRLSEILIPTTKPGVKPDDPPVPSDDPEMIAAAQAKAEQVLAELNKGGKFAAVAQKYSGGPTADKGGDLGYFKRGTLAKELEDKTFAMKAGEHTDVIRTKQGFVILAVTEHSQPGIPALKDIEPRIQEAIYMEKLQPALRAYLTRLREDAFIDIKQGYVDAGASPNQTKPVVTTVADSSKSKDLKKKKKHFLIF